VPLRLPPPIVQAWVPMDGALVTDIAVSEVMPALRRGCLRLVAAITIAVPGRYHDFVDAVAALLTLVIAWAFVRVEPDRDHA
jgi:hypothetical protein